MNSYKKRTSLSPSGLWTFAHVPENGCHSTVYFGGPGLSSTESIIIQLIKEQLWYYAICCTIKWLHGRKSHEPFRTETWFVTFCFCNVNTMLIYLNKELITCGCGTYLSSKLFEMLTGVLRLSKIFPKSLLCFASDQHLSRVLCVPVTWRG